ncbi:hypothetical protein CkaCkLH20_07305 [Colletotrichum karsti]|uniref:Uncharacterized protein n=1 Tax=Colletotrichum karsti TaxID=1095194 RepID=A0A9P6LGB9_9PEZI|nr:uncharacterized protein CkaCkLH20_07305 [Colletotrichum karsti]KAF9875039.1 hypothetical protein CkaCkLH20_07305 [Colletotrichum karsti]
MGSEKRDKNRSGSSSGERRQQKKASKAQQPDPTTFYAASGQSPPAEYPDEDDSQQSEPGSFLNGPAAHAAKDRRKKAEEHRKRGKYARDHPGVVYTGSRPRTIVQADYIDEFDKAYHQGHGPPVGRAYPSNPQYAQHVDLSSDEGSHGGYGTTTYYNHSSDNRYH